MKYPIGTHILYDKDHNMGNDDSGKTGIITGYRDGGSVFIKLPNSAVAKTVTPFDGSFSTEICNIEVVSIAGEQLLFNFM